MEFFKISFNSSEKKIRNKGKSLSEFPESYVVLDLETTGLDFNYDEIIEVGLIKVRDNQIVDEYSSLVKPKHKIDEFIEELTGITNEDLKTAPTFKKISKDIIDFIDNDIIVGHNVHFDINFLYDALNVSNNYDLKNDFFDLLKMSRRILKEINHHRLKDLAEYFNYDFIGHRAINDCKATYSLLNFTRDFAKSNNIDYSDKNKTWGCPNLKELKSTVEEINPENYFYGKHICFTGKLKNFTRKEAAQILINLGAVGENTVNKSLNILILGSFEDTKTVRNNKSTKLLKAEQLMLQGQELIILDEDTFLNLLEDQ